MTQDLDRGPERIGDQCGRGDADRGSRHGPVAQLLIAWSPLSLILVAYAAATWISAPLGAGDGSATNRLGFGVHVTGPAAVDRHAFGAVPSVWLQERLVDGSVHWYDAVAALVYVTHFVAIPLVTAIVWFCVRDRFARWIGAVLVFTTIGTTVYVVCPAAPPWLASQQGAIGQVDRISNLGWELLRLDWIGVLSASGQGGSNPVAAMPSLHAGATVLIALFLWPTVNAGLRAALVAYVLVMAVVLVYTGEHYVVDVVAGWLTAAVAVWLAAVVRPTANPR
ncbi:phosphatase PAP2 family protein [Nocardioides currus]|nr:phosphatase PAP2 family protein [Nocardioides currus]